MSLPEGLSMSAATTDTLPTDVPLRQVPTEGEQISEIANEYGIEESVLVNALNAIQADLGDYAPDIHRRYTAEWGDNAIIVDAVIWEVIYVYRSEWEEIRERLELAEDVYKAANAAHQRVVEWLIAAVDEASEADYLQTNAVLIMPTPLVGNLLSAGLSRRQAQVEALRMAGNSHKQIGEKLGNATGTVKSHCDRIDRKLEQARHLIELVDDRDNPVNSDL